MKRKQEPDSLKRKEVRMLTLNKNIPFFRTFGRFIPD